MNVIAYYIKKVFPKLEHDLISAKLPDSVDKYAQKIFMQAVFVSLMFSFIAFFILGFLKTIPVLIVTFFGGIFFFANYPKNIIRKREKEIKRNLLFAGRYLLIKIESGEPLFMSLIGVSKSYGAAGKAFREIVQDIQFGTSMENAIDNAIKYNPCKDLTRILWELSNSIKTGTDINKTLTSILEQISKEYILEIEKYGKKLNSLTLFYLVTGVIFPSLGVTMLVVLSSFINMELPTSIFYIIGALLIGVQIFFIALFKGARPAVNL